MHTHQQLHLRGCMHIHRERRVSERPSFDNIQRRLYAVVAAERTGPSDSVRDLGVFFQTLDEITEPFDPTRHVIPTYPVDKHPVLDPPVRKSTKRKGKSSKGKPAPQSGTGSKPRPKGSSQKKRPQAEGSGKRKRKPTKRSAAAEQPSQDMPNGDGAVSATTTTPTTTTIAPTAIIAQNTTAQTNSPTSPSKQENGAIDLTTSSSAPANPSVPEPHVLRLGSIDVSPTVQAEGLEAWVPAAHAEDSAPVMVDEEASQANRPPLLKMATIGNGHGLDPDSSVLQLDDSQAAGNEVAVLEQSVGADSAC
eukprot:m.259383 g.259383  ORF g.259383 m.259383 type:complete len:307 (-) comp17587_c0_seq7:46-966(-)